MWEEGVSLSNLRQLHTKRTRTKLELIGRWRWSIAEIDCISFYYCCHHSLCSNKHSTLLFRQILVQRSVLVLREQKLWAWVEKESTQQKSERFYLTQAFFSLGFIDRSDWCTPYKFTLWNWLHWQKMRSLKHAICFWISQVKANILGKKWHLNVVKNIFSHQLFK
jgi:hypothetical protein